MLLEALSPALAAELDRLVQETPRTLETEFQQRLQQAVGDAESAAQARLPMQAQAIAEASDAHGGRRPRNSSRNSAASGGGEAKRRASRQPTNSKSSSSGRLDDATDQLKAEAAAERQQLQEATRAMARLRGNAAAAGGSIFAAGNSCRDFCDLAEPFADGLAVYVAKADGLASVEEPRQSRRFRKSFPRKRPIPNHTSRRLRFAAKPSLQSARRRRSKRKRSIF